MGGRRGGRRRGGRGGRGRAHARAHGDRGGRRRPQEGDHLQDQRPRPQSQVRADGARGEEAGARAKGRARAPDLGEVWPLRGAARGLPRPRLHLLWRVSHHPGHLLAEARAQAQEATAAREQHGRGERIPERPAGDLRRLEAHRAAHGHGASPGAPGARGERGGRLADHLQRERGQGVGGAARPPGLDHRRARGARQRQARLLPGGPRGRRGHLQPLRAAQHAQRGWEHQGPAGLPGAGRHDHGAREQPLGRRDGPGPPGPLPPHGPHPARVPGQGQGDGPLARVCVC
mmetsp:Transcript_11137/g.37922  ORF Transcript_11137/g.37922 Transcript_11137/m.37922 type:complete len:288 (-) Transcript_11137:760-1623(-)